MRYTHAPRLVAVILTHNEAQHIAACVTALHGWVDAVVVWDSGSQDETCRLAQSAGALVVQRRFDNFAAQRQAALDTIASEWIFFVDADERVTPALAAEIGALVQGKEAASCAGYTVARRNFIAGQETHAGGFFPDYQLRLLRHDAARYVPEREVHEIVRLSGPQGVLQNPLLHYNYKNWRQFHHKQRYYARYEARILAARGVGAAPQFRATALARILAPFCRSTWLA